MPQPKTWKCSGTKGVGREKVMLDVIFILATALFFTVGIYYVRGCERLKEE
jgi:hypothetical protein